MTLVLSPSLVYPMYSRCVSNCHLHHEIFSSSCLVTLLTLGGLLMGNWATFVAGTDAVSSNGGICVIGTVIQWIPTFGWPSQRAKAHELEKIQQSSAAAANHSTQFTSQVLSACVQLLSPIGPVVGNNVSPLGGQPLAEPPTTPKLVGTLFLLMGRGLTPPVLTLTMGTCRAPAPRFHHHYAPEVP